MRDLPVIRNVWEQANGKFVGSDKPHGRVTIEPGFQLNLTGAQYGASDKGPYRWFQRSDNSQTEIEVPNILTIKIDRSIDQDAAKCEISIANQWHDANGVVSSSPDSLGNPGYFSFNHGQSSVSADFGQVANEWADRIVPNALLRTYQGYGGDTEGNIQDLVSDGNLAITGLWLVDTVTISTEGILSVSCRDMAKLLIDQKIYLPLVPSRFYPLKYCRWQYEVVPGSPGEPGVPAIPAPDPSPVGVSYVDSSMERWYPGTTELHGRRYDAVADGSASTVSWSQGVYSPSAIFARAYWEVSVNQEINEVYINAANSSFGTVWISIMVNGQWISQSPDDIIPWDDNNGDGRSDSLYATQFAPQDYIDKPFLVRTSVGNAGVWVPLPFRNIDGGNSNVYDVQRIRITTNQTWNSQVGPWVYRAVCQRIDARLVNEDAVGSPAILPTPATPTSTIQHDGNVNDYTEIVRDLLLWSGFLLYEDSPAYALVHGILEYSGAYPLECVAEDYFDKKSVMECINGIRDTLGYIFVIDDEGGVKFHTPNWWSSGNTLSDGTRVSDVLDLHDESHILSYTTQFNDSSARSQIIVGSSLPTETDDSTAYSKIEPASASLLRGMIRPAMWINEVWQEPDEQLFTAAIIALHSDFQARTGSVTIPANPEIQIDDQVRITERISGESYSHYVRGVSTSMNLDTGDYTMTLTTNWLGEEGVDDEWAFDRDFFLENFSIITDSTGYDNGSGIKEAVVGRSFYTPEPDAGATPGAGTA